MELIEFLLQECMIRPDDPLRFPELVHRDAFIACQADWFKPEFCIVIIKIDMNVWRFTLLVLIEMEPEGPDYQHGWHHLPPPCK
jgi:hypothetical protein